MLKSWFAAFAAMTLVVSSAAPQSAEAKTKSDATFSFPKDKPIKIILFRPDLEVASLGAGGVPTPNPDWTLDARKFTQEAVTQNQAVKFAQVTPMPELTGEDAAYAAEYQSLYRAVSTAVFTHGFLQKLPTKKQADGKYLFDWTMGSGAKRLGELGGGNYGLFVHGFDAYATGGRKAMQIFVLIATSALGAPTLPQGGQHFSYASLVDLDTGKIVWFNFYANKKGDIRTREGAQERADILLSTLPLREGEVRPKPKRK
jgi:hypothetical protein